MRHCSLFIEIHFYSLQNFREKVVPAVLRHVFLGWPTRRWSWESGCQSMAWLRMLSPFLNMWSIQCYCPLLTNPSTENRLICQQGPSSVYPMYTGADEDLEECKHMYFQQKNNIRTEQSRLIVRQNSEGGSSANNFTFTARWKWRYQVTQNVIHIQYSVH